MKHTRLLKRFGVLMFSVGFALMMAGDVFHIFGGILILLSVWNDLFVQEMIDDHFEDQMSNPPPNDHHPSLRDAATAGT